LLQQRAKPQKQAEAPKSQAKSQATGAEDGTRIELNFEQRHILQGLMLKYEIALPRGAGKQAAQKQKMAQEFMHLTSVGQGALTLGVFADRLTRCHRRFHAELDSRAQRYKQGIRATGGGRNIAPLTEAEELFLATEAQSGLTPRKVPFEDTVNAVPSTSK
jgi:hypothetical protein